MDQVAQKIAVVQGAPSAAIQDMFRALVAGWRTEARIAGIIAEGHDLSDQTCGAGYLRSIATGEQFQIFQDLGPGSTACHLDGAATLAATAAALRDIAAGCDLVVVNKFGRLEAARTGLLGLFTAAIEADIPVLTSVSPAFAAAWERFAAPLFVVLPADPGAIDGWWRAVRPRAGAIPVPAAMRYITAS